jgi:hypothetical protein
MISPTAFQLSGQGKPLPKDFPYKGEWLVEPRIFLYRPENPHDTGIPEITPVHQLSESEWCFGINSITLSRNFGVGSHEIFAHNRAELSSSSESMMLLSMRGTTLSKLASGKLPSRFRARQNAQRDSQAKSPLCGTAMGRPDRRERSGMLTQRLRLRSARQQKKNPPPMVSPLTPPHQGRGSCSSRRP